METYKYDWEIVADITMRLNTKLENRQNIYTKLGEIDTLVEHIKQLI